jgi:hypothetical protein
MTKPELYNDDVKNFLNELRDSAVTNMLGASPYLQEAFDMSKREAKECLKYWIETFGGQNDA